MNENKPKSKEHHVLEKIPLSNLKNEKWLQDIIEDDPRILGLGDIEVINREHPQSSGGRIDFVLMDDNNDLLYEVEIQLGKTDPSHIIRTIEYWENESRRYQSYEHKAVLIAEEITSRFFNAIYLMNRYIPIIAMQLDAFEYDGKILLNFSKILDTFDIESVDIETGAGGANRDYWIEKVPSESMDVADDLIKIYENKYNSKPRITYNKYHIALGTRKRNFLWLKPRKSGFVRLILLVDDSNVEETVEMLESIDISFVQKKKSSATTSLKFPLKGSDLETHKDIIIKIIVLGIQDSSI
ncbi:MAG: hypothetical protein ACOC1X_02515 [Promethearchaeota archaeon]